MNRPPQASFTVNPSSGNTDTTFTFDASSSYDPDGSITKYEWDWENDGYTDLTTNEPITTYTYPKEGYYTVRLRVYDEFGLWSECTRNLMVEEGNQPPYASFTVTPSSGTTDTTFTFDASSSYDPDGSITKYEWDWNGDGVYDDSSPTPTASHSYTKAGTYRVTLRVTDSRGATAMTTSVIEVSPIYKFSGTCAYKETREFTITVDKPGELHIEIEWNNAGNDLDMWLLDPSGKEVAYSAGSEPHEEITISIGEGGKGKYTLVIAGYRVSGTQEFSGTCNYPISPV